MSKALDGRGRGTQPARAGFHTTLPGTLEQAGLWKQFSNWDLKLIFHSTILLSLAASVLTLASFW